MAHRLMAENHRWRNRDGRMAQDPQLLFLEGPGPSLLNVEFCLNIICLRNTISIGSSVKENRLMKKMLQNFGSIWFVLFII